MLEMTKMKGLEKKIGLNEMKCEGMRMVEGAAFGGGGGGGE